MRQSLLVRLVWAWILCSGVTLQAAPVFGRYVGVVTHTAIQRDQLAKLDFIPSREEGNVIVLKAVLTLHFGDFRSGEYVSYHFDNVRFNLLTQAFVFDQADQPVTLVGKQLSANEFSGELRSAYTGDLSQVYLRNDQPAAPKLPLVEPVWGEYRGKCDSKVGGPNTDTIVQAYTYRSSEGASQVGNPFRAYKIKGFLGEFHPGGCLSAGNECVWGNIKSGSYNFFKNRLLLFNTYRNLDCKVDADALNCGGCGPLKRVSRETAGPRSFIPPVTVGAIDTTKPVTDPALVGPTAVPSLQGEYVGYVHHEYLNRYQAGSLNILTYQAPSEPGQPATLRMSAIGTLYFGSEGSAESISYKFNERSYPNPLTTPQFTFSQADADVDAILQVTSLGNGVVKGVWFSQRFGRVGNFEFRKSGAPTLPSGSLLMEEIAGHYESTQWEIDLNVGLGTAAPNTENPFAPLTFEGWTILTGVTPKAHITGGSYDFYTGRIGFEVGDNIVHLGERLSRAKLRLKKLYYASLTPMPSHDLQPYRLSGEQP